MKPLFPEPVTNFFLLGDGRSRTPVVIVVRDRIHSITNVIRNQNSTKRLEFTNGLKFVMTDLRLNGEKPLFYLYNERPESWDDKFKKQQLRDSIGKDLENSDDEDIKPFAELLSNISGEQIGDWPWISIVKTRIRAILAKRSLSELRQLDGLLAPVSSDPTRSDLAVAA